MFADQPGFVARQMLLALIPDPLRWSIGDTDADSGKAGFELASFSSRFASFTVCHTLALATNMSSAGIDRIFGTCRCRGRPRLATGQVRRTSTGYTLR